MALEFPISPFIGQTYQSGSSSVYIWTGTYWKIQNLTEVNYLSNEKYNIDSASFLQQLGNINGTENLATTGSNKFNGDQQITGSLNISVSASIAGNAVVTSPVINSIVTISSASYAALNPPISGTLYIII